PGARWQVLGSPAGRRCRDSGTRAPPRRRRELSRHRLDGLLVARLLSHFRGSPSDRLPLRRGEQPVAGVLLEAARAWLSSMSRFRLVVWWAGSTFAIVLCPAIVLHAQAPAPTVLRKEVAILRAAAPTLQEVWAHSIRDAVVISDFRQNQPG